MRCRGASTALLALLLASVSGSVFGYVAWPLYIAFLGVPASFTTESELVGPRVHHPSFVSHFDEILSSPNQSPLNLDISGMEQDPTRPSPMESRTGARPFYVIGHMANTIREAREFLKNGANALEVDLSFSNLSNIVTFHDFPCDCFRICRQSETLGSYLNFIRDVTDVDQGQFRDQLALIFFDLKLDDVAPDQKHQAGVKLGEMIVSHLWRGGRTAINVLVSMGRPEDRDVVSGVIDAHRRLGYEQQLEKRVGWDVGLGAPLGDIKNMWQEIGVSSHLWQGDGITNCLSTFRGFKRLKQALSERNSPSGYMTKVYHWTIDFRFMLEYSLRHHVDGVITNHPERALKVLANFKPGIFRLATPEDDPWTKVPDPPEVEAEYPSEGNLRRLLMSFTLRNGLGVGLDLADSALDLFKNLLAGASPRDMSWEELSEVYQFVEKMDEERSKGEDSILGEIWQK